MIMNEFERVLKSSYIELEEMEQVARVQKGGSERKGSSNPRADKRRRVKMFKKALED
jgi:hypothetical protein